MNPKTSELQEASAQKAMAERRKEAASKDDASGGIPTAAWWNQGEK
jgi:hypothetical protein